MNEILEGYLGKIVKVGIGEGCLQTFFVGKIICYDRDLIELNPGIRVGQLLDERRCIRLIKDYEASYPKQRGKLFEEASLTGRVVLKQPNFSIEELIKE